MSHSLSLSGARWPRTGLRALALAGAASIVAVSTLAQAQTWEYKAYKKPQGGQYSKDNFVTGTISLEEKDGKAFFRMAAGGAPMPASVAISQRS